MPNIKTIKAGNRYYKVTTDTQNNPGAPFLELGPAGTSTSVSTLVVQFSPSEDFTGSFAVLGRVMGNAANDIDAPFLAIPYRRINLGGAAQDYALVSAFVTGTALIQIPANGLSVVLMNGLSTGKMDITIWDLQGSSAI